MTKQNMINAISAKEAALWLEMAKYDSLYAPVNCTLAEQLDWDMTDEGHLQLLHAWNAVNELMEDLGIETDFGDEDRQLASELRTDLFRRRQAARGIFYN